MKTHTTKTRAGAVAFAAFATLALAAVSAAQTVGGTMTTTLAPSGNTAEQEFDRLVFELRKGGLTERHIALSEAELRETAARIASGLECSGPFEYSRSGDQTYMRYPVAATGIGVTQDMNSEAFDGTTTVLTDGNGVVVRQGDRRTFTGNPLWQAALLGHIQPWLAETSAAQGATGEQVVYEATDPNGFRHRMVVQFRGQGRTEVATVEHGYVSPDGSFRPAASATRSEDGSLVAITTLAGGKPVQEIRIAVDAVQPQARFDLLLGVVPGSKVVDMRLGDRAPVNYVFAGSLPSVESLRAPTTQEAGMPTVVRIGLVALGIAVLAFGVRLWRR